MKDRKFTLSLLFVDRPMASCARMSEKGALIATKSDRMASLIIFHVTMVRIL
jgi:hypothetical protein